jgi:hypothetical protein
MVEGLALLVGVGAVEPERDGLASRCLEQANEVFVGQALARTKQQFLQAEGYQESGEGVGDQAPFALLIHAEDKVVPLATHPQPLQGGRRLDREVLPAMVHAQDVSIG